MSAIVTLIDDLTVTAGFSLFQTRDHVVAEVEIIISLILCANVSLSTQVELILFNFFHRLIQLINFTLILKVLVQMLSSSNGHHVLEFHILLMFLESSHTQHTQICHRPSNCYPENIPNLERNSCLRAWNEIIITRAVTE